MSDSPRHPVRIVISDDLHRSRLTVFFRGILVIPHYIWASLIGTAVGFGVFANWFILLVKAQTPEGLHNFIAGYLRYLTHLEAYIFLAADPYPPFYPLGDENKSYPIDLLIDPPVRQNRWKVFFRLFLALPAMMFSSALFFGGPTRGGGYFFGGAVFILSFLAWFVAMVRGRVPRGMRDLIVYCLGYAAQLGAYIFLVTDRYPYAGPDAFTSVGEAPAAPIRSDEWVLETVRNEGDLAVVTLVRYDQQYALAGRRAARIPAASAVGLTIGRPVPDEILGPHVSPPSTALEPLGPPPQHPVSMTVTDELRRSRVLTLFRLPVAIPHIVWLILWTIVAMLVSILNWICALAIGRAPRPFHRFLSRYVRYTTHLSAFLYLVGNPFPGFVGKPGTYPVDLHLPDPEPQKRVVTFFRFLLAFPALLIAGCLYGGLLIGAILGWFVSLILGRMPEGFRNMGAFTLRYAGQVSAYLYLLTAHYPYSGPHPDPSAP